MADIYDFFEARGKRWKRVRRLQEKQGQVLPHPWDDGPDQFVRLRAGIADADFERKLEAVRALLAKRRTVLVTVRMSPVAGATRAVIDRVAHDLAPVATVTEYGTDEADELAVLARPRPRPR